MIHVLIYITHKLYHANLNIPKCNFFPTPFEGKSGSIILSGCRSIYVHTSLSGFRSVPAWRLAVWFHCLVSRGLAVLWQHASLSLPPFFLPPSSPLARHNARPARRRRCGGCPRTASERLAERGKIYGTLSLSLRRRRNALLPISISSSSLMTSVALALLPKSTQGLIDWTYSRKSRPSRMDG